MRISARRIQTVTWLGIAEEVFFNLLGVRDEMPKTVIAFLPLIGAIATVLALLGFADFLQDWARSMARKRIRELESFLKALARTHYGLDQLQVSVEVVARFQTLSEKHKGQVVESEDLPASRDYKQIVNRVALHVEIFRAYGYVRGWWKIHRRGKQEMRAY